jgi:hypothetical protein
MADIIVKHLIETDDRKEGHLYKALCKEMTRFEGEPKDTDAVCRQCVVELMALYDEAQKELTTYREMYFPTDSDVPNN